MASNSFDFPLDPALFDSTAAAAAASTSRAGGNLPDYLDDEDDGRDYDDDSLASDYEDEDYEDGDDEEEARNYRGRRDEYDSDEMDAENEYARAVAATGTTAVLPGRSGAVDKKGKGRAQVQFQEDVDESDLDEDDDEDDDDDDEVDGPAAFSNLIHAIRDSTGTDVGQGTALGQHFDAQIAAELDDDREASAWLRKKNKRKQKKRSKRAALGLDVDEEEAEPERQVRPRRIQRRTLAEAEPSNEVRALLSQATEAYVMGEHERAIEFLTEVVRIEPIIRHPWYTLATIHEEMGQMQKSIQARIVATLLSSQAGSNADWAALGSQSRDLGLFQQAVYCYSMALRADKHDTDSMWDRAVLMKLSGSVGHAIRAFESLNKLQPHDTHVLRELVPLLDSDGDHARAAALLEESLEHYRTTHRVPRAPSPEPGAHPDDYNHEFTAFWDSIFNMDDLIYLADMLIALRQPKRAIAAIRTGARWLQGRGDQSYWDTFHADDREFDLERRSRENWELSNRFLEEEPVYGLDTRLRLRLGHARLLEGRDKEARHHFKQIIEAEDVSENPDMFGAIGNLFFERHLYEAAYDVYTLLLENDETNTPPLWLKMGECALAFDDVDGALEFLDAVVENEPEDLSAKMLLARALERKGDYDRALAIVNEIAVTKRRQREWAAAAGPDAPVDDMDGTAGVSAASQARRRRRKAQSNEERAQFEMDLQQEYDHAYSQLSALEPMVAAGDQQALDNWLAVATTLVDGFRETPQLFPSDGKAKYRGMLARKWGRKGAAERDMDTQVSEMTARLEGQVNLEDDEDESGGGADANSFRAKSFGDWLRLIISYAFRLALNGEFDAAQETLEHVSSSVVYRKKPLVLMRLRIARASCYLQQRDWHGVETMWRLILFGDQVGHTLPFSAIYGLLSGHTDGYTLTTSSQFLKMALRQVKFCDTQGRQRGNKTVPGPSAETADKGKQIKREDSDEEMGNMEAVVDDEGNGSSWRPSRPNPIYSYIYGTCMLASKSYQSAIVYLLRAYEQLGDERKPPTLLLSLGIAYLHRGMQRIVDNRHYFLVTALAYLSQYRDARIAEARKRPEKTSMSEAAVFAEVHYNFGRTFQMLTLTTLAVKSYNAVLRRATAGGEDDQELQTLARLAAFNLVQLYSTDGGNVKLAGEIASRWLSI